MGAKAFGVLLQHGVVRSVLPVNPPTYIVFDEQIEKLKGAGIPFTVVELKEELLCHKMLSQKQT